MNWLIKVGLGFLLAYILFLILLYFSQRRLLYFPPAVYLSPSAMGIAMEEVKNADDEIISWWSAPVDESKKTIMVFHGNGSAIYSNHDIFSDLISHGYGVLSVGYPGYPGRRGKPTQRGLVEAALSQYEWLQTQGIPEDNIVFYGTSLGSGVAAQLADLKQPSLLIMDAPFNSISEMAQEKFRWIPVKFLMKDGYHSGTALSGKEIPLLWIHGTEDNVVPLSQGQKLFDNYEGPKSAHVIKGGQHTNLWPLGGRDFVLAALED